MRNFTLLALALTALATIRASLHSIDQYGNDLADCTCECGCGVDPQAEPVRCDVDLVILISAAACVKDYVKEMKTRVMSILDDYFDHQDNWSDSYAGYGSRVSIISYSTKTNIIFNMNQGLDQAKAAIAAWDYTQQLNGDKLGVGLEEVYNMFNANPSAHKKALIVLTNGGIKDSERDGGKTHSYSLKLRSLGVDIMVNTITDYCEVQKDCLMCCPDKAFLQSVLATSDRICDNSEKVFIPQQGYVRAYDAPGKEGKFYRGCLEHLKHQCAEAPTLEPGMDQCGKQCSCVCDSVRPGIPGIPGPPGQDGVSGLPGAPGAPGPDGKSGIPGNPGSPGNPGPDGKSCIDGQDGNPGRQGVVGECGLPGSAGSIGLPGANGNAGPAGAPGPIGEKGGPGAPGNEGPQGPAGPAGPCGEKGAPGAPGSIGQPGNPGSDGDAGPPGLPGNDGQPGQPGLPGPAGQPGRPGECGRPGAPGSPGSRGIPGVNGVDGRQGPTGAHGSIGSRGVPGRAGRIDYSVYRSIVQEEVNAFLAGYGWTFTCDGKRKPVVKEKKPEPWVPETTQAPPQPIEPAGCETHDDNNADLDDLSLIFNDLENNHSQQHNSYHGSQHQVFFCFVQPSSQLSKPASQS